MDQRSRRSVVAAALALAACIAIPAAAQDVKGKLVLYTSQPERDASQTVAAFRRVQPGVDVEVFRSGTTEVMGKLAAEFSAGLSRAHGPLESPRHIEPGVPALGHHLRILLHALKLRRGGDVVQVRIGRLADRDPRRDDDEQKRRARAYH